MLKKVHIKNFLSCQDTEIEFDNITALIGRNAAGKSNILKTIEWCAQSAVGNIPNDFFYDGKNFYTTVTIDFFIKNKVYKYERYEEESEEFDFVFSERLSCYLNNKLDLIAERKNGNVKHYNVEKTDFEINHETPMISSMIALLPQKILNSDIKIISSYLSEIKYYNLDEDNAKNMDYISDKVYREWLKGNKEKSSVLMRLIHIWNVDKELLNELQEIFGINGLNLTGSINIIKTNIPKIGKSNEEIIYRIRFNTANTEVSYNQLSYGTQRVLAILLALLYDKNSTLLIEQPEDGIHSGLLTKLLPLCFEYAEVYNKQLIIATHSPEIINLLPPESIRLVKMTENGTKVSALSKEQMPFIHDYLKNEGALFDFIKSMNDE